MGLATRLKLATLRRDPVACAAWLRGSGVSFAPAPLSGSRAGCGAAGAVRLGPEARLQPSSPAMDCPAAAAYLVWVRAGLAPVASRHGGLAAVEHVGSYACRPIAGTEALSQHARARALDVTALRFRDGTRLSVEADWRALDGRAAELRRARDAACGLFSGVLSPDYNAAHRTHLHLDVGPYAICS